MQKPLLWLKVFVYVCVGASTIATASAYTVTIKSPANGTAVASPVTVNAQVDSTTCNSGFQYLQVLVNGKTSNQEGTSCSFSPPVTLPLSSDTLNVQAIRWDGALMAQSTITVTVAGNGPKLYVSTAGSDSNLGTSQSP